MRKVLVAFIIMLAPVNAYAFKSTNSFLLEQCVDDNLKCEYYIAGLLDGTLFQYGYMYSLSTEIKIEIDKFPKIKKIFGCLPESIKYSDMITIWKSYSKKHPNYNELFVGAVLSLSLNEAFPC